MDGTLICTAIIIAIVLLRLRGQESDALAYAPVRVDTDDNSTADASCCSSFLMHESLFSSSDDDWLSSSTMDDSPISIGYESDTNSDMDRWADPMYAYEPGNIYHDTPVDPTYHDDDWSSCTTSFDDSFSSSSSDDSWSESSFDDSFSSSISFND